MTDWQRTHEDARAKNPLFDQLKELTVDFREGHAKKHDHRAHFHKVRDRAWSVRQMYYAPGEFEEAKEWVGGIQRRDQTSGRWHEQRARGQRERFEKVNACGARTIHLNCNCCGRSASHKLGCGVIRLCPECSVRYAMRRRARFSLARAGVVLKANHEGHFRRNRRGGAFSEKMLTLTVPHVGDNIQWVAERVRIAFDAWRIFSRRMQAYWRRAAKADPSMLIHVGGKNYKPGVWMHRAFEWTPGKDGFGHPHFHVWLLCPFIPKEILRKWWTAALREARCEFKGSAVINIMRFQTLSAAAAREVIKGGRKEALKLSGRYESDEGAMGYADGWDLTDTGGASVTVVAELYKALEGRRISQGARGFYVRPKESQCPDCHETNSMSITMTWTDEPLPKEEDHERGPP